MRRLSFNALSLRTPDSIERKKSRLLYLIIISDYYLIVL